MSRKDAVVLVSRALAVFLAVWVLAELTYLPISVYSFLHYAEQGPSYTLANPYWHHHSLMSLGFLITRIIGYSLMSMWLYKGGSDIEELLLPTRLRDDS